MIASGIKAEKFNWPGPYIFANLVIITGKLNKSEE